ncbi:hypothetical protein F1643_13310 [Azospirillum sp. INR13]|uniref:hypothetical protein n=1 Tax=Azospirillum sp. INR13 TaxID=2596919 RepID=UPI0018922DD9|nr:hypothetical protein [Azospirillum sp. INR13]MBF5095295.1 hypothetical protein [Azospirillum sp. INR13]
MPSADDLSMDPVGRADAGETAATAIRWALTRRGVGSIGDTLANWAPAATIGAWWPGAVRYRELIDLMARSEGAAVLPDALGRWQVARLDVPAAPIASIGEGQILDIGVDDQDLAVPVWQVTVRGRRNHLVLDRGRIAGQLWDTDREVWLREEWRKAVAKAEWVKARWGDDARAVEVDTALTNQSDMEALATRLLTLLGPRSDGTPRRSLWVVVELTAARLGWQLGRTLHLSYPREGIADDMLLLGMQPASPSRHLMRLASSGDVMGTAAILDENLALTATLSGGNWALPLEHLLEPTVRETVARCVSGNPADAWFDVSWPGPGRKWDTLVIAGGSIARGRPSA